MHELLPATKRFVVLVNPANASSADGASKDVQKAALGLGLETSILNASSPDEIDAAFSTLIRELNTYAVIGVGVFRDLEHIGRSAVVKFHGQRIRREDVVGDVTAPLSGDVFICHCIGAVCRTDRRQNCNRYKPGVFHGSTLPLLENPRALYVKRNDGEADFGSRITS